MNKMVEKYPVITTIVLFFAGVTAAGVLVAAASGSDKASSLGRIIAGITIFILCSKCFELKNSFKSMVIALPLWLLALYKIPLYFLTNGEGINKLTLVLVLAGLAPAVFEEILFRGVLICGLQKKGKSPMTAVMISAAVFSLAHLTNFAGLPLPGLCLQVLFSFSVGVALGGVYLHKHDLMTVIIIHAAIDLLGGIFPAGETTPYWVLVSFAALIVAELAYGIVITRRYAQTTE